MKVKMAFIACLIFLISAVWTFSEMQVGLTLLNNIITYNILSNSLLGLEDGWQWGGDFDAHLTVNPGMTFEENYQADSLLDVFFKKSYTGELNINIRQAFIDFLFFDMVSIKAGLIQTDYGFNNNHFHPMDVSEFMPEFSDKYPDLFVGANNLGMPGVPSVRVKMAFPEFIEGLKIGLDQGIVWFDFNWFEKNYFLSSLTAVYANFQAGAVLGYNGDSFKNDPDVRKPVLGMNMLIGFPFNFFLFWEGIYRQESYRAIVEDDTIVYKREDPFFNQSVRIETRQTDPFFHNTFIAVAEYFYYGEGLSSDQYDEIYLYLDSHELSGYNSLIINERNFKHYLTSAVSYMTQSLLSFSYGVTAALDIGIWQHSFSVLKIFDTTTLSGTVIYIPRTDDRYQLVYGARELLFYLQLTMEI